MHQSSYDKMTAFCCSYLESRQAESITIVDLGSHDINGSYRPIFARPPWRYVGIDLVAGENVDVVLRNPYSWPEIASRSADVLVSGQTIPQRWRSVYAQQGATVWLCPYFASALSVTM